MAACTFLASSSSSINGNLLTTSSQAGTSCGQRAGCTLANTSKAETTLSRATRPRWSRFFGAGPAASFARLRNASGTASAKTCKGAARLMAYAAGMRTSGSWAASAANTAGTKTGRIGWAWSFRCSIKSQPRNNANARCFGIASHCCIRWAHSGKHWTKSPGAVCITRPMASSQLRRQFSSSSWSSSSSSSSPPRSWAGALATFAFLPSSALLLRSKDLSMSVNKACTSCTSSWPLKTPGPALFKHSAMPSAVSFTVSGSSSSSIFSHAF
mmetsp:Transcript_36833/g.101331  ORF Transcript_36833/g.101331 Transcript_36833/m.101331 type:complete len:270 (-) Transcript_36833:2365-3174(-)